MKDNFSAHADDYAKYRPVYPPELFAHLNGLVAEKDVAWDCGTGNGQVAFELAKTFEQVYATDISQAQINNAARANNIHYSVQPAEKVDFPDNLFDLIVVAQAIHWFQFDQFYAELRRTAKKDALLCVTGYGKIEVSDTIDPIIENFYNNTIGAYWDEERKYVEEEYKTIPFPFEQLGVPHFVNTQRWTLQHLLGYLNTWSAVKHFIREKGYNPVDTISKELEAAWGSQLEKEIKFPILLRIGRVHGQA